MLDIYTGAMGSGKTAQLLDDIGSYSSNPYILICCAKKGIRKNSSISSRDGREVVANPINSLKDIKILYNKNGMLPKYIFVDEVQFLNDSRDDIKDFIDFLDINDIHAVMSGLNINCYNDAFNFMERVMPYADDVVVFKGRCEICGRKTSNRALRYLDNKLDIEKNNKEFITDNKANVKYVPICNYCRLNLTYKGK